MTSETVKDESAQDGVSGGSSSSATPQQVDSLALELKEQQNKYVYLYAEFENYKKRAIKERSEQLKFGHENFARELLQVTDNLERALQHAENNDALVRGIKMVHQSLVDTLSRFGVAVLSVKGSKFDPSLHEAIAQQETEDDLVGFVTEESQKGYTMHGRLLRPAKVVVGIAKGQEQKV